MPEAPHPSLRPTWTDYWNTVGNETWLAARELIELSGPIRQHFEAWLGWQGSRPTPHLDWAGAAAAADTWPCSTTERILLDLVLGLIQPDEDTGYEERTDPETGERYEVRVTHGTRTIDPRNLAWLGSWTEQVAQILARWMSR